LAQGFCEPEKYFWRLERDGLSVHGEVGDEKEKGSRALPWWILNRPSLPLLIPYFKAISTTTTKTPIRTAIILCPPVSRISVLLLPFLSQFPFEHLDTATQDQPDYILLCHCPYSEIPVSLDSFR
jgi:hypothetical protein